MRKTCHYTNTKKSSEMDNHEEDQKETIIRKKQPWEIDNHEKETTWEIYNHEQDTTKTKTHTCENKKKKNSQSYEINKLNKHRTMIKRQQLEK